MKIFTDIETAPSVAEFNEFTDIQKEFLISRYPDHKDPWQMAGLHAETGKIVCISTGYMRDEEVKLKSFTGEENGLLKEFNESFNGKGNFTFIGHNIKEFDLPWIHRRFIANKIKVPSFISTRGLKPWEMTNMIEDTMEIWGSTNWRYRVSLKMLCEILGVKTPKDDMDGSQVGRAFYDGKIKDITTYCEKDVVATAECYELLNNLF